MVGLSGLRVDRLEPVSGDARRRRRHDPAIFFAAGFPAAFNTGAHNISRPTQGDFFSSEAFINQGAPYIAAVLAYAIGNQTIAQRLFAVREDLIKPTFSRPRSATAPW